MPAVKLVGNLTTGVVLLYGGYRVLHGEMTIGTLVAFLLYLRMFFEPMRSRSSSTLSSRRPRRWRRSSACWPLSSPSRIR